MKFLTVVSVLADAIIYSYAFFIELELLKAIVWLVRHRKDWKNHSYESRWCFNGFGIHQKIDSGKSYMKIGFLK